jgi:hypothetical protein
LEVGERLTNRVVKGDCPRIANDAQDSGML